MGSLARGEIRPEKVAQSIRELWQGRSNASGEMTLAAGATSTVVKQPNCAVGDRVTLTPRTANAANAVSTTYVPAADVIAGQFTVRHTNLASTDRTFGYEVRG